MINDMDDMRISGTAPSSVIIGLTNIKSRLQLRYIHHFKSDLNDNMRKMKIPGSVL